MDSLISIIVPVYNVEKFIKRCLDSIIHQTYTNLEIILVDDGSNDNSGAICDQYAQRDHRIKVYHQKNKGLSEARNKGLDRATGDYIGFVDSDDWIEKDMYSFLYENMKQYDADIASCKFICVEESGKKYMLFENDDTVILDRNVVQVLEDDEILRYHVIENEYRLEDAVWTKLFKKSLFSLIRFPQNKLYEDTFIMYKLLDKAKKVVVSYEIKYNYFIRSGSITNSPFGPRSFDIIDANIQRYGFVKTKYPELEPLCRKALLKTIIRVLFNIEKSGVKELYQKQMQELIDVIKSVDIYSCGLPADRVKVLKLFAENTRKGFLGLRMYSQNTKP